MAVFPFSDPAKYAYEPEWRDLFSHIGDGVVGDYTGGSLRVLAAGDSRVVRMQPGKAKVQGFGYTTATQVSLDAAGVGQAPAAGQRRIDWFVLRLDVTAKTITPTIIPGTPATNPVVPPLTQNPTGTFDLPLAQWTAGPTAITQSLITDKRAWLGPNMVIPPSASFPDTSPMLGSTMQFRDVSYIRSLNESGNPAWVLHPPRMDHWGWFWGGRAGYGPWYIPSGSFNLPPGGAKVVNVTAGKMYRIHSSGFHVGARLVHNIAFRISIHVDNTQYSETSGIASDVVPNTSGASWNPLSISCNWRSAVTGPVTVSTRFASGVAGVTSGLYVRNAFDSPFTEVTELGTYNVL